MVISGTGDGSGVVVGVGFDGVCGVVRAGVTELNSSDIGEGLGQGVGEGGGVGGVQALISIQ